MHFERHGDTSPPRKMGTLPINPVAITVSPYIPSSQPCMDCSGKVGEERKASSMMSCRTRRPACARRRSHARPCECAPHLALAARKSSLRRNSRTERRVSWDFRPPPPGARPLRNSTPEALESPFTCASAAWEREDGRGLRQRRLAPSPTSPVAHVVMMVSMTISTCERDSTMSCRYNCC
jgi:hypothetical protein